LRTGLVNPLPILKSSLYRPLSSQFQKSHFPPHFQSSPLALARWVCFIGGGNGRARRDVALTFGRLSNSPRDGRDARGGGSQRAAANGHAFAWSENCGVPGLRRSELNH
jgi:hypothetical protein